MAARCSSERSLLWKCHCFGPGHQLSSIFKSSLSQNVRLLQRSKWADCDRSKGPETHLFPFSWAKENAAGREMLLLHLSRFINRVVSNTILPLAERGPIHQTRLPNTRISNIEPCYFVVFHMNQPPSEALLTPSKQASGTWALHLRRSSENDPPRHRSQPGCVR